MDVIGFVVLIGKWCTAIWDVVVGRLPIAFGLFIGPDFAPPVVEIPTLRATGLALLALLLATTAVSTLRRPA